MARPQTGRLTRAKGKHSVKPHRFHSTITVSMSHPGTRKKTQKKSELRSEKSGKSFATFFTLTACFSIAGVPAGGESALLSTIHFMFRAAYKVVPTNDPDCADKSTALDVHVLSTCRARVEANPISPGEISSSILSMGKTSPSIVFESTNTLPSPQQSNRGSHKNGVFPGPDLDTACFVGCETRTLPSSGKSFIRGTKGQSHGTAKKHQVTHGHFLLRRDFSPDLHGLCSRS
uniref:Uncharacterized protein n=1 Tax=Coccidioides posadasii RMSCC 3488 TaxID=454284 RepID=A0A0J6I014_COCPO|nr:hypothetical protein CPAG_00934 [Coccidioides posadasii RMSCC 3488]